MIHWLANASTAELWLAALFVTLLVFFVAGVIAQIRRRF